MTTSAKFPEQSNLPRERCMIRERYIHPGDNGSVQDILRNMTYSFMDNDLFWLAILARS